MRVQLRRVNERGAAAILIAIFMVMFTGLLAFVVDYGMAYTNIRSLQSGADAGALAAAREVVNLSSPAATCTELAGYQSAAESVAKGYFAANWPAGDTRGATVTGFSTSCTASKQFVVSVTATQSSPALFGGIFGASSYGLTRTAKAVIAPASVAVGIRPFAICDVDARYISHNPTTSYNVVVDNNEHSPCGDAAGNWGWLDLNSGSNGTGDIGKWIEYGYPDPVGTSSSTSCTTSTPDCIESSPGKRVSLNDELEKVIGKEIVFPVFDSVTTSGGSNVRYHITGFLSAQICGWKLNQLYKDTDYASVTNKCYSSSAIPTLDNNLSYVQVRFRKMVPVGEIGSLCTVETLGCDFGVRIVSLGE